VAIAINRQEKEQAGDCIEKSNQSTNMNRSENVADAEMSGVSVIVD
jgi:hypothetical protein